MSILISVLLIVEVIAAFLLIVVILAQKSKDQGLGMAFGGGMGESLFGSRAGNVLTRMTITLAAVFMVNTILLGILFARKAPGTGSVMDRADRAIPMAPAAPMAPGGLPPPAAPIMAEDIPVATPSAPMIMQIDEAGEMVPVGAIGEVEVVPESVDVPAASDLDAEPEAAEPEDEPVPQE